MRRAFIAVSLVFCFALTTVGCNRSRVILQGDHGGGVQRGPSPSEPRDEKGPPPWVPAHGYRAKHSYRYYPEASVSYDTGRGVYFYYRNGSWQVGASLPYNLRVELGDYVSLEMDTEHPYEHHSKIEREYPPGQMKNKSKGKKSKGRGKGKGKWKD